MGWLIALGVLLLLGAIPVGANLTYLEEVFGIRIKIGFLKFSLPKGKEKKEKPADPEKQEKQQKKAAQKTEAEPEPEPQPAAGTRAKKRRPIKDYLPFVRLALDLLGSLRRKLRVEKLYLKVILAGDDPCDLAVNYGRAWAGASTLMGNFNQILVIRDQDLDIQCDFTGEKTILSCRVDLTITIGRILGLAVLYGLRALKEFVIFKKRKGGAAI